MDARTFSPSTKHRLDAATAKGDGCWMWTGHADKDGYGVMRIGGRRTARVHRAAFAMAYGPFKDELLICHTCDTPACVRPDHLFPGTPKDNTADMFAKGRAIRHRGDLCVNTKLHSEEAKRMVGEYINGKQSQTVIAAKYGVTQALLSQLLNGAARRSDVPAPVGYKTNRAARARKGSDNYLAKLQEYDVVEIRRAYAAGGVSQQVLADRYGVRQTLVSRIILRQCWTHV